MTEKSWNTFCVIHSEKIAIRLPKSVNSEFSVKTMVFFFAKLQEEEEEYIIDEDESNHYVYENEEVIDNDDIANEIVTEDVPKEEPSEPNESTEPLSDSEKRKSVQVEPVLELNSSNSIDNIGSPKSQCNICGKSFVKSSILRIHMMTIHQGQKSITVG